mmetsp:Transcript_10044/g.36695  ORF Transcript_10044/g.36695 Transcript_10044/m.36695 type:complete len:256 (-) Transcript_10044:604-1371(-)
MTTEQPAPTPTEPAAAKPAATEPAAVSKGTKWFPKFVAGLPSMEGKTVVLTGTTTGCGKIASRVLLDKGARVICLNRKSERATKFLEDCRAAFPDATVDGVDCDLQSFQSVREAASQVKSMLGSEGSIDVLCNNAGVMAMKDVATADGYDVQMQVNHLSHFLLTKELFPLISNAAAAKGEARIVNHSSIARSTPKKPLEAKSLEKEGGKLGGDGKMATWTRYQQTKLANCLFTYGLRDRHVAGASSSASPAIYLR